MSIPADYPISVPGCSDATFSSGPIAWQARRPVAPGALGASAPFAGAMLYGTNATLQSQGTDCIGHIQIVVDGSPRSDMTASAVAMNRDPAIGSASLTTTGLAVLGAGTHEIRVQGSNSPGCPETGLLPFINGGLHAVVLDN